MDLARGKALDCRAVRRDNPAGVLVESEEDGSARWATVRDPRFEDVDRAFDPAALARLVAQEVHHPCARTGGIDQLGEFVSEQVGGSGAVDGLAGYIDRVKAVCTAFPDYRWELQELVVEEDTIAARLIGQGTHAGPFDGIAPTGRMIRTQELVIYRFADGKIVQCWGDLFPVVRDALASRGGA